MNCDFVRENLSALIDSELGHETEKGIREHIAGCSSCRAEFDKLQRVSFLLDNWVDVEVPSAVYSGVQRTLENDKKRKLFLRLLPVAAAIVLVISVYLFYSANGSRVKDASFPAAISGISSDLVIQGEMNEDEIISNLQMLKEKDFYDSVEKLEKIDDLPFADDQPRDEGNLSELHSA